jgi:hypothetical protein
VTATFLEVRIVALTVNVCPRVAVEGGADEKNTFAGIPEVEAPFDVPTNE